MEHRHVIQRESGQRASEASAQRNGPAPSEAIAYHSENQIPDNIAREYQTQHTQPLNDRKSDRVYEEARQKHKKSEFRCRVYDSHQAADPGLGIAPDERNTVGQRSYGLLIFRDEARRPRGSRTPTSRTNPPTMTS